MAVKNKILLLTLVHPISLPPVFATAQVLRDEGYEIEILSFDHVTSDSFHPGEGITIKTLGLYQKQSLSRRLSLQLAFIKETRKHVTGNTVAVFSFCAFSFYAALKTSKNSPVFHISLEIPDYSFKRLVNSPLSTFYNYKEIKNLHKAFFVATPSFQRSAWLAGKAGTKFLPDTILNTTYISPASSADANQHLWNVYKAMVPASFLDKKILLYTGSINADLCIKEFVDGFCETEEDCCMILVGIKDNEYCRQIKESIAKSGKADRTLLLPFILREEMIALQSFANIGVFFAREIEDFIYSRMIAPNKVGEYLARGLFLLGNDVFYLQEFKAAGVAELSTGIGSGDIAKAISNALKKADNAKDNISRCVTEKYNMRVQLKNVITRLEKLTTK